MERSQTKSVKKGRTSTRIASRSFALLLFCLTVSLGYAKDAEPARENVEQGVLGEILGLDPGAATPPASETKLPVKPSPRALDSTAETLDKYQAKLLADRRVGYGISSPQTTSPKTRTSTKSSSTTTPSRNKPPALLLRPRLPRRPPRPPRRRKAPRRARKSPF